MYSVATLRFRVRAQEVAFRKFLSLHAVPLFRKFCFYATLYFLFYNLVNLVMNPDSDSQVTWTRLAILGLSVAVGSAWLFVRLFHKRLYRPGNVACLADNAFEPAIAVLLMASLVLKHSFDISTGNPGILFHTYTPVFIIAFARIRFTYLVMVISCHLALIVARYWILAGVFQDPPGSDIGMEYFALMLGIVNLTLYYSYQLEMLMRKDYFVLDSIARSEHQGMEILKGMFPEEVVSHVLLKIRRDTVSEATAAGHRILGDRVASVLFIDLMDFDALVADLQPEELVQLLDQVWNLFDRLVERNGVTKIETVGKTYMAAALPEDSEQTPIPGQHARDALSAVATAVFMLEETSRRFTGHGKVAQVSVRIGIHTGRVLSGVVGSLKPQFALFGDTVNTASRMQSTGKRNQLHVSGATWEHLKDDPRFSWEARMTEVKGKGLMDTYLLSGYRLEELKKLRRRTSSATVASLDRASRGKAGTAQKVSGIQASLSRVLTPKGSKISESAASTQSNESVLPELKELHLALPKKERMLSKDQSPHGPGGESEGHDTPGGEASRGSGSPLRRRNRSRLTPCHYGGKRKGKRTTGLVRRHKKSHPSSTLHPQNKHTPPNPSNEP
jgi:class 3 adenylate cyclase